MHGEYLGKFTALVAAAAMMSLAGAARADFVFGNFESGLDPFLQLRQDNGGPNTFNGSVPTNATSGTMAGSFSTAPGFQQYLRYDNGDKSSAGVLGQLANYNDLAFDINVPAGDVPSSFYVHEVVFNGTEFPFAQSGNLRPAGAAGDDLKGAGTVTLDWPYRTAIPGFDAKYAAQLADSGEFFQVILVSNYGNGWDGNPITVDNLRLTNPVAVPEPASIGLVGAGAMALLARRRRA
jgi:hypothetical protein